MIWYVHRRSDGSIASAHAEPQAGYAEEAVEDTHPDYAAYLAVAFPPEEPNEGGQ